MRPLTRVLYHPWRDGRDARPAQRVCQTGDRQLQPRLPRACCCRAAVARRRRGHRQGLAQSAHGAAPSRRSGGGALRRPALRRTSSPSIRIRRDMREISPGNRKATLRRPCCWRRGLRRYPFSLLAKRNGAPGGARGLRGPLGSALNEGPTGHAWRADAPHRCARGAAPPGAPSLRPAAAPETAAKRIARHIIHIGNNVNEPKRIIIMTGMAITFPGRLAARRRAHAVRRL